MRKVSNNGEFGKKLEFNGKVKEWIQGYFIKLGKCFLIIIFTKFNLQDYYNLYITVHYSNR